MKSHSSEINFNHYFHNTFKFNHFYSSSIKSCILFLIFGLLANLICKLLILLKYSHFIQFKAILDYFMVVIRFELFKAIVLSNRKSII